MVTMYLEQTAKPRVVVLQFLQRISSLSILTSVTRPKQFEFIALINYLATFLKYIISCCYTFYSYRPPSASFDSLRNGFEFVLQCCHNIKILNLSDLTDLHLNWQAPNSYKHSTYIYWCLRLF